MPDRHVWLLRKAAWEREAIIAAYGTSKEANAALKSLRAEAAARHDYTCCLDELAQNLYVEKLTLRPVGKPVTLQEADDA